MAARIAANEWTMEAVIPLAELAPIGFASLERIRVPRPDTPELRWQWPAANERMDFELPTRHPSLSAEPVFQPACRRPSKESPRTFTGRAAELAAEGPGRRERSADDAQDNLRQRMKNAAIAERTEWQKVKTRSDWEMFRDQRITALRKSLGPFPERTPLCPAVTRRIDTGEGFVIENVVYESMPGRLVPANLYLPSTTSTGRIPAIVVVHSHHAPKTQSELQDMGMTWARAGVAVLVPDQPGAGERIESQAWPRESYYSRYAMSMQLYLAGESLMKWMVWDLMRGIDLLLTRPSIDPQRIVMLGAVAGGGDPAAVTAALDSRIAAVIPFNFGEAGPEEHYTEGPRPYDFETADPGWGYWESTRNLHRSAAGQFFPWLICVSVAPRPFLFSFEIGWPKTVEEEPMPGRAISRCSSYTESERISRRSMASVHSPAPANAPTSVVFCAAASIQYSRVARRPDPASEYHNVRPDAELMAITPETAAERKPKTTAELALAVGAYPARARPSKTRLHCAPRWRRSSATSSRRAIPARASLCRSRSRDSRWRRSASRWNRTSLFRSSC